MDCFVVLRTPRNDDTSECRKHDFSHPLSCVRGSRMKLVLLPFWCRFGLCVAKPSEAWMPMTSLQGCIHGVFGNTQTDKGTNKMATLTVNYSERACFAFSNACFNAGKCFAIARISSRVIRNNVVGNIAFTLARRTESPSNAISPTKSPE